MVAPEIIRLNVSEASWPMAVALDKVFWEERTYDRANRRAGTQREEIVRQKKEDQHPRPGETLPQRAQRVATWNQNRIAHVRAITASILHWLTNPVVADGSDFTPGRAHLHHRAGSDDGAGRRRRGPLVVVRGGWSPHAAAEGTKIAPGC